MQEPQNKESILLITTERISKHIIRATVCRPKALNAINFKAIEDLEQLVDTIDKDKDIRVLIFSGEGTDSFISGGDLKEFHTIIDKQEAARMSTRMHQVLNRLEQLPCWNIAFINGDAYGGGIELMLAFDFRVATDGVKLGFTQGRFYLSPGWGGLTRLVEKVGRAKALLWLGKSEIISSKIAFQEGLIEATLEPSTTEKKLIEWAEKLTKNDRDYIRTLKSGTLRNTTIRKNALASEIEPFSELWVSKQHIERVTKFLKK